MLNIIYKEFKCIVLFIFLNIQFFILSGKMINYQIKTEKF